MPIKKQPKFEGHGEHGGMEPQNECRRIAHSGRIGACGSNLDLQGLLLGIPQNEPHGEEQFQEVRG